MLFHVTLPKKETKRETVGTLFCFCVSSFWSRQLARSNKVRSLLHLKINVNLVPILFMEKLYFHVISFTQAVKKSVKLNVLKK